MNTKQKKALYESIMKNVAKTVKKNLNESFGDTNKTRAITLVSLIDNDNILQSDLTKAFINNADAQNYFTDLFREICEENGMTCTDDNMDELDAAIDNGFFIFSDGTTITINEITLKY